MAPRRRNSLSERQRFLIAKHSASHPTLRHNELVTWASKNLGITVDRTTITKLLKRKDLLLKEEHEFANDVKRSRSVRCPKLDDALYRWFLW